MTARSEKTTGQMTSPARAPRPAGPAAEVDGLTIQELTDRIRALEAAREENVIRMARVVAERDALERDVQLNAARYRRESRLNAGVSLPQAAVVHRITRPSRPASLPDLSVAEPCSTEEFRRLRNDMKAAMQSRDWAAAVALAPAIIRCRPSRPASWIQYGNAAKEAGDIALAEHAYFHALALDAGNPDVCEHLGHLLRLRGELALAAEIFRGGLVAAPWASVLRDKLADMNQPAPPMLDRRPAKPRRKMARWWFKRLSAGASSAALAGRWSQAATRYGVLTRLYPAETRLHIQLGHALKEQGKLHEAEASYRRALALQPLNNDAWLHLGHALKLLGRMTEAQAAYHAALRLYPENAAAEMELRALDGDR